MMLLVLTVAVLNSLLQAPGLPQVLSKNRISNYNRLKIRQDGLGCLFSESLCRDEEFCYDDYAFGRCLPLHGHLEKEAFYRFDLLHPDLRSLQKEMDHLFSQGYRWSHTYTQCILQALLDSIQMGEDGFDRSVCNSMMDQDLEAALRAIEGDEQEKLDQRNLAYVQFTPSASNPHPEFADEVYFPPLTEPDDDDIHRNMVEVDPNAPIQGYYPYEGVNLRKRRIPQPEINQPSASSLLLQKLMNIPHKFQSNYNTPEAFRLAQESRDENVFFHNYNTPKGFREGHESRDDEEGVYGQPIYREEEHVFLRPELPEGAVVQQAFGSIYENEQDKFDDENGIPSQLYSPVEMHSRLPADLTRVGSIVYQPGHEDNTGGGYAEGGLIFLPDNQEENLVDERVRAALNANEFDDGLDAMLAEYDPLDWGFKRRERLDVKKPGPPFTTNNYAFRDQKLEEGETELKLDNDNTSDQVIPEITESWLVPDEADKESQLSNQEDSDPDINKEYVPNIPHMLPQKKELPDPESTDGTSVSDQYDIVDTTYAYIGFKNGIQKWVDGTRIVKEVARLLGVEPEAFTKPNVHRNEVAFKVEPNSKGLNASEVAKRIDSIKGELKKRLGIEVTSAGIGNKTKLPSVLVAPDSQHEMYIATFLLCGAVAAVLVAASALYVIRRHARSREKLQNLSAPDTEASKDYQDLCRARMANKTQQEKPEPIHVGQARIASLSRESEGSNNSPSSRSSTSSWSEEPALTNMDISTGHMVLSYMEDHLKNKDRLEQEWVALCAYEAEPCTVTVALKPENSKKNRYTEFLPYDHSRVVLNDLANISGSDYINASTITDHDPRNPAYIATQGPLPHTAPDFWQMIWEQGSVVMVMLTRLTEGGTAMCHRYWPEEGSELYHIYEVHLVSEHIWCDDYLVRSFYLKNLKTGETRTVTQFHFLSWPDGGVPLSTKPLLEFRRKVNKSYRGRSCPIVVHCSDGVGRTGTYCLIDMVLNRMAKGAKEIDIAATLEHIRDQRQAMVRTKQQFEFVLMAVADEVHAILKALPSQQQQQPQSQQQQPPPQQQPKIQPQK